jgi:cytochrome c oxidase assembly factor CtaG
VAAALAAAATLLVPAPALAHGDETAVADLGAAWSPAPAVLAGAAVALLLFVQAYVRLRRRGRRDHAPAWRLAAFVLGLTLIVLALISPLDAIAEEYLLSAHMLQHVLISDAAIALLLLAVSGPLLFFLLPAVVLRPLARYRPLRALLAVLSRPTVALLVWAVAIAAWHVPALYEAALERQWVHDLEHVSLVAAGLLVWFQLLDPARHGRSSRGTRIGLIGLIFLAGQVLSTVLLTAGDPLYAQYALQDERLLDLSALTDQRLAGAVMMVEQAITLGTLGAFLLLGADQDARRETAMRG